MALAKTRLRVTPEQLNRMAELGPLMYEHDPAYRAHGSQPSVQAVGRAALELGLEVLAARYRQANPKTSGR